MVLAKEIVISIVVPLNRRGMRAHWTFNYGTDQKSWDDRPIWIARNHLCSDDFLSRHNHSLGCAHTFQHYAEVAPAVRVPIRICALHVNNGHVRVQRPHCPERFFRRKRRKYLVEKMTAFSGVAPQRGFCGKERNPHRARLERECQREVGQVEDLHSILLDRPAKVIGGTHHHIAHPRGDYFLHASCTDQLIEENV